MKYFSGRKRLWRQNQTSLAYTSPEYTFYKEERFQKFSIYSNMKSAISAGNFQKKRSEIDEIANRISRLIDSEQKNEKRFAKKNNNSLQKLSHSLKRKKSGEGLNTNRSTSLGRSYGNSRKINNSRSLFYSTEYTSGRNDFQSSKVTDQTRQNQKSYIKFKECSKFQLNPETYYSSKKTLNRQKLAKINSTILGAFCNKVRDASKVQSDI